MVLLLQVETTSRVEIETKMATLTETQLNMLTQVGDWMGCKAREIESKSVYEFTRCRQKLHAIKTECMAVVSILTLAIL